jgi:hypothetical protein
MKWVIRILLVGAAVVIPVGIFIVSAAIVRAKHKSNIEPVCRLGDRLLEARLLDQALVAYGAAARAAGHECKAPRQSSARSGPDAVRVLAGRRDDHIERARALRVAAAVAPSKGGRADLLERARYRYMYGLAVDAASPGAHRGLRALLRQQRRYRVSGPPDVRCERAGDLLREHLLAEARYLYAPSQTGQVAKECSDGYDRLREDRLQSLSDLRTARSRARAKDIDGARASYLDALGRDRSLEAAWSDLDRLPLPVMSPDRSMWSDAVDGIKTGSAKLIGASVVFALAFAIAALLAGALWRVLRRATKWNGKAPETLSKMVPRLTRQRVSIMPDIPSEGGDRLASFVSDEINRQARSDASGTTLVAEALSPFDGTGRERGIAGLSLLHPAFAPVDAAIGSIPRIFDERHARVKLRLWDDDGQPAVDWVPDTGARSARWRTVTMADVAAAGLTLDEPGLRNTLTAQIRDHFRT